MRKRLREGVVAAGRGVVLAGWSLVGLGALTALVGAMSLLPLGVGVYLVPGAAAMVRRCADQSRRWAGRWSQTAVESPYRQRSASAAGFLDRARLTASLLVDPTTYRDVAWLVLNPIVSLGLALLPATLIAHGLYSFTYPFIWQKLAIAGDWYLLFPTSRVVSVAVALPFGLLSLLVGAWAGPALLRAHGRFTRWLLGPPSGQELAWRVEHLARTRSEAVDAQAAELRRIERDLHDGAQARLVAMGMNLGAGRAAAGRRTRRPRAPAGRGPADVRARRWPSCATWCAASTRRCWPTAAWRTRCGRSRWTRPLPVEVDGRPARPAAAAGRVRRLLRRRRGARQRRQALPARAAA